MKRRTIYEKAQRWGKRHVAEVNPKSLQFDTTGLRREYAVYGYLAGYQAGRRASQRRPGSQP